MNAIMQLSEHIDKNNLHHAYLIEGEHEQVFPEIISFLGTGGTNITKETFELFTINDARALRAKQVEKSADGQKKFFLISVGFFTREAENALLKVFEEPAPGTHFFVVVPSAEFLLPTLRSRFMVLTPAPDEERNAVLAAKGKAFLKLSKAARLEYIADFIEEHKDEDKHDALKGEAVRLLNAIESVLAEKKSGMTRDEQFVLKQLWMCKHFLRDRGASTKMLLEYIALIV